MQNLGIVKINKKNKKKTNMMKIQIHLIIFQSMKRCTTIKNLIKVKNQKKLKKIKIIIFLEIMNQIITIQEKTKNMIIKILEVKNKIIVIIKKIELIIFNKIKKVIRIIRKIKDRNIIICEASNYDKI